MEGLFYIYIGIRMIVNKSKPKTDIYKEQHSQSTNQLHDNKVNRVPRPIPPSQQPASVKPDQVENTIIDVTNTVSKPIQPKEQQKIDSQKNEIIDNWIQQLNIPYERSVMQNQQMKNETLRIYNELCTYVDVQLKKVGRSLNDEVKRIASQRGYYDNLLYTFYCIAEGHVTKGFSGSNRYYNYDYSYQILEKHLGWKIKEEVYQKAVELEKYLNSPSQETITEFHLTAERTPIVWWDRDGKLRAGIIFTEREFYILNATPARYTKIWSLLSIRKEVLFLYLHLWELICEDLNKELNWKKTSLNNIEKILNNKYSYPDYNDRTINFLFAFLKISESTVRDLLPKSSYTQTLNIEKDNHLVSLFLPKETMEKITTYLDSYKKNISKDCLKTLVSALADSEAATWKIIAEKLYLSNKANEWIDTLVDYQTNSDYDKVLKELVKNSENENLVLLAVYELGRINNLSPTLLKRESQLIPNENKAEFVSYISEKKLLSSEVFSELLEFKKPIRRKIKLNPKGIERSREDLEKTVATLEKYTPEDDSESTTENLVDTEVAVTTVDTQRDSVYSEEAMNLVKSLLENNTIAVDEIKKIALKQGKLLNSYISDINKEFFDQVEDQLVLVENDIIKIDDFYVDLAKELLEYEN